MIEEEDDSVRVVCFIPKRTNQIYQAHASLEGISKQELLGDILTQFAETLEIASYKKEKEAQVVEDEIETES